MLRRQILKGSLAVASLALAYPPGLPRLLAVPAAQAAEPELFDDDHVLGEADAGVIIVEYASLTCPHCATFHKQTLPQVRSDWIEAGKAALVFRHYPLDGLALRAAALANCFEGERFFTFLGALFDGQQRWVTADDSLAELGRMARLAGLDQARAEACLSDEAEMNHILERMKDGQQTYGVQSTPTFIVSGRKLSGAIGYEEFDRVLQEAAAKT